jgi:hypothetical protein
MKQLTVWHGSAQETTDLVTAITRNCQCEFGAMGVRLTTCPAHKMMLNDQRALNGLLFVRRKLLNRCERAEFTV